MKLTSIDLSKTNRFSKLFTDYIDSKAALAPFYDRFPKIDNFKEQIKEKQFSLANRQILCQVLEEQYKDYEKKESLEQNLKSLARENTFTITTGHQLNIFTGPLYFIYKIVTVINSCRQLSKAYPDYNFVPVYWMASEDHDFDEISYFWLNGQKHRWETVQSGAVGRFMTDELSKLCDEIPGMPELFKEAYQNYDSLADAGRCYVNALFGDQGLVVIDADNRQLKSLFTSVIEDDVLNNTSYELVEKATADLQKLGYSTQVNPRKINFFYLSKGFRERIENDNEAFKVLNSDISLSKQEILTSISNTPEKYNLSK